MTESEWLASQEVGGVLAFADCHLSQRRRRLFAAACCRRVWHLPAGTLEPARLSLLADALEDAGCDNAELLAHLRSEGPHVRGCHVLDALLGKGYGEGVGPGRGKAEALRRRRPPCPAPATPPGR